MKLSICLWWSCLLVAKESNLAFVNGQQGEEDSTTTTTAPQSLVRVIIGFHDEDHQTQFEQTSPLMNEAAQELHLVETSTLSSPALDSPTTTATGRSSSTTTSTTTTTRSSKGGPKAKIVHYHRTNAVAVTLTRAQLDDLRNQQHDPSLDLGIDYIEPDTRHELFVLESEIIPYGIDAVHPNAETVNNIPVNDALLQEPLDENCFKICVIDDGLMLAHPDIPFVQNDPTIDGDEFGLDNSYLWYAPGAQSSHGTHVTGTIVAEGNNDVGVVGVIPDPAGFCLLIAKVFDETGFQDGSIIDGAAEWCADNGAKVINMSLGSPSDTNAGRKIYEELEKQGVLVIAATGNDGDGTYNFPASYDSVVSVAAVDQNNARAAFSQFNDKVDLAAPGVNVLSTTTYPTLIIEQTGSTNRFQGDRMSFSVAVEDNLIGKDTDIVDCQQGFDRCEGANNKICLIERGETFFKDKALNCENAGGVAALIYNNAEGLFFGSLSQPDLVSIPVYSISRFSGLTLLESLNDGDDSTEASLRFNELDYGYAMFDGTSMASPHVAGVAAKIWAARPQCTHDQIREAMYESALDLGAEGRDDFFGHGLVRATHAYEYLLNLDEPCGRPPSGIENNDGSDNVFDGSCLPVFESCTLDSDCCSGSCRLINIDSSERICRSENKNNKEKLGDGRGGAGGGRRQQRRKRKLLRGESSSSSSSSSSSHKSTLKNLNDKEEPRTIPTIELEKTPSTRYVNGTAAKATVSR